MKQLHAGKWHFFEDGRGYWRGDWCDLTKEELLEDSLITIRDLLINHPELSEGTKEIVVETKIRIL